MSAKSPLSIWFSSTKDIYPAWSNFEIQLFLYKDKPSLFTAVTVKSQSSEVPGSTIVIVSSTAYPTPFSKLKVKVGTPLLTEISNRAPTPEPLVADCETL